jgi:hypothetical protein
MMVVFFRWERKNLEASSFSHKQMPDDDLSQRSFRCTFSGVEPCLSGNPYGLCPKHKENDSKAEY